MKRNLDAPILNLDGKPFEDLASLKTLAFMAVTTPIKSDEQMPVADKIKLYALAHKTHLGGVVDFSSEELALLKTRIGGLFTHVIVVGRAFELLDADYVEV